MRIRSITSVLVILTLLAPVEGAVLRVKYTGGSLPIGKVGDDFSLSIDSSQLRLARKEGAVTIPSNAVTEISYGQEVHRRIGTAVLASALTLGLGAIVAFSKSKKHYIGIVWDDHGNKGGMAMQVDKNDFRGILAGLEGVTGKKAVDTDNIKNRSN